MWQGPYLKIHKFSFMPLSKDLFVKLIFSRISLIKTNLLIFAINRGVGG